MLISDGKSFYMQVGIGQIIIIVLLILLLFGNLPKIVKDITSSIKTLKKNFKN